MLGGESCVQGGGGGAPGTGACGRAVGSKVEAVHCAWPQFIQSVGQEWGMGAG